MSNRKLSNNKNGHDRNCMIAAVFMSYNFRADVIRFPENNCAHLIALSYLTHYTAAIYPIYRRLS